MFISEITPGDIVVGFSLVTFLFWLFNHPRSEDFRKNTKFVKASNKLMKISKAFKVDTTEAEKDLNFLIAEFSGFQPAQLLKADYYFETENYERAMDQYESALKIGSGKPIDYIKYASSASKLGNYEKALEILRLGVSCLPAEKISGVMFFNMACYLARLGFHNKGLAIDNLKKAINAGFTKGEYFRNDPDLDSLRSTREFQELVKMDCTFSFNCTKCDHPLRMKEKFRGRTVKCPKCKLSFKA